MIKAETKFRITTDIRKLLIENTGITAMVGTNVYPIVAPDEADGNMIIYYRDQYSKDYSNFGIVNENCKVFIAIISDNYDESISIVEQVNEIIEGVHTTKLGYQYECRLEDSTEDFADKKYIQILLFEIK